MKNFLKKIGLVFDPEAAIPTPFSSARQQVKVSKDKPKKQSRRTSVQQPDKYIKGTAWTLTETESGDIEYNVFGQQETGQSVQLSDVEKDRIREAGLDIHKAGQIKVHLKNGLTARQTSLQFERRGYGQRTVEKYYSILNQPLPQR